MDKWPGGQNGGNYCHRTEYRKINKSIKRNEDSLRGFWDNIKFTNIHLIRVPKEEEREKGLKKIFEETIAEKFPNMGKERVNQVQEVQRIPGRINPRRNTPRHIIIKLTKIKDRVMLSHSVVSNSLLPQGLQPVRLLWPRGFSRQEYWSGLPCPPPGDLPNPGIEP